MRRLFLCDCKPGDLVEDVLVVTNTQFAAGSNGKQYIKAFVSDRTAQLTARMWNATRELFAQIPDNSFVRVRGRIENYQNNLQLIIESFAPPAKGSFDLGDLVPTTSKDVDTMCQRVFEILNSIKNEELKALIQAFLDDEDLMNDFARAPAASSFHHAYVGGLLEHTLSLLEIADRLVPLYPGLSRDLCLAGCFLHDIAKTWELTYDAAFNYSDGGQLIGHSVKAVIWIEQKGQAASRALGRRISPELVGVLQHIVLSHHGQPEYGAAKVPATPEALFVHLVDNIDAKMMMALTSTRTSPSPGPDDAVWTEFLKPFGYRFYRPDPTAPVALPDASSSTSQVSTPSANSAVSSNGVARNGPAHHDGSVNAAAARAGPMHSTTNPTILTPGPTPGGGAGGSPAMPVGPVQAAVAHQAVPHAPYQVPGAAHPGSHNGRPEPKPFIPAAAKPPSRMPSAPEPPATPLTDKPLITNPLFESQVPKRK